MLDIILVTYNRLEYTRKTISSILTTLAGVTPVRWIIVDNVSTEDGYQEWLDRLAGWDNVTLIKNTVNVGWGAAVNQALTHSTSEWVLISNNDCIYKRDWYEGAKALYDKYRDRIGILGLWKHIAHGTKQDLGDLVVKDDMPAVAWLLKRELIDKIGPFAEKGPCPTKGGNGEDTDYTQRAMAAGYWVCGPKDDLATHITGY